LPANGEGYSVIADVQHQLVFHAALKNTTEEVVLNIPVSELHNGLLHLTVFNREQQPVAERLVFLNYANLNFSGSVISEKNISNQARALNELELTIDSTNWISYAASVSDAEASNSSENILSGLWLGNDLQYPLQHAAGYFTQPDDKKAAALDALLISEKWRRFSWEKILQNHYPVITLFPHNYLSLTGKVTKGNKLRQNEEVNMIVYYPDSTTQLMQAVTDSSGQVIADRMYFSGEAKIFYQLNTKKAAAKQIDILFERNNQFMPYSLPMPLTVFTLADASEIKQPSWVSRAAASINMEEQIDKKYKTLKEVVLRSSVKTATEQLNEKLSSGMFRTSNAVIFDFVNEEQNAIGYFNILQWLAGRVAGLDVEMNGTTPMAYIRGAAATLYVDEMPADSEIVGTLNISDIAMVKVIKGPSAMVLDRSASSLGGATSSGAIGGVIAIYTSRGQVRPAQREPSLPSNKVKGYDEVKNYFVPFYNNPSAPQPDKDTRDQLNWKSLLSPTIDVNKARLEFFNNDNTKRFKIIVQGFTESGFPVFTEKIIEPVKKAF
jgi:hypothetical protein